MVGCVLFLYLPCHATEEPQEFAAPKDGCHSVSADPPAPLLMLLFALLKKSLHVFFRNPIFLEIGKIIHSQQCSTVQASFQWERR